MNTRIEHRFNKEEWKFLTDRLSLKAIRHLLKTRGEEGLWEYAEGRGRDQKVQLRNAGNPFDDDPWSLL